MVLSADLFVPAAPAWAAPSDPSASRAQYRQAYEAIKQKNWAEARRLLMDLWTASPTYDVAASLGQVEYALGHYSSGASYMAYALAHIPPKEKRETVERYQMALQELKTHVAAATVTVNQAGAEVSVDSNVVGRSPLSSEVYLDPGNHVISAQANDQLTQKEVSVEAGKSYSIELDLPPSAAATAAAPNGAANGSATAAARSDSTVPPLYDDASTKRSWVPVYIGAGVTVIGAGLAIGFGLSASSNKDEATKYRQSLAPSACVGSMPASECGAASDAYDRQRRDAMISTVGIGIAAVGAVATVGYLLWPSSRHETASLPIEPHASLSRSGASFDVTTRF
jgi:hypothetical protein